MDPCTLTASITALANALACRLTDDELTLLSSVLVQLGDTLATIVTRRSLWGKCGTTLPQGDQNTRKAP